MEGIAKIINKIKSKYFLLFLFEKYAETNPINTINIEAENARPNEFKIVGFNRIKAFIICPVPALNDWIKSVIKGIITEIKNHPINKNKNNPILLNL